MQRCATPPPSPGAGARPSCVGDDALGRFYCTHGHRKTAMLQAPRQDLAARPPRRLLRCGIGRPHGAALLGLHGSPRARTPCCSELSLASRRDAGHCRTASSTHSLSLRHARLATARQRPSLRTAARTMHGSSLAARGKASKAVNHFQASPQSTALRTRRHLARSSSVRPFWTAAVNSNTSPVATL